MPNPSCECKDPGCPCRGKCNKLSTMLAFRVDMEDNTGTCFCGLCGEDAYSTGLFYVVDQEVLEAIGEVE